MLNSNTKATVAIKYPKLKRFIENGIASRTLTKRILISRLKHPEHPLWKTVCTPNRIGMDVHALYDLLEIPTNGKCLGCGKTTCIEGNSARPKIFCTSICARSTEEVRSKLRASRRRALRRLTNNQGEVQDRSTEFPELKRKLLYAIKHPELDISRDSLTQHLQQSYPDLYSEVKHLAGGTNVKRLLEMFALPTHAKCKQCGTQVELGIRGFTLRSFCSNKCKAKNAENPFFKWKTFVDSRGNNHRYQGYEDQVLSMLDKSRDVIRFTTSELPTVSYEIPWKRKPGNYHPDIGVVLKGGRRMLIEVKSPWTLYNAKTSRRNPYKFQAAARLAKSNGFEFWLVVIDNQGCKTWIQDGKFW